MRAAAVLLLAGLAAAACQGQDVAAPDRDPPARMAPSAGPSVTDPATSAPAQRLSDLSSGDFEVGAAVAVVRHLAGVIGPRHATSESYRRAADWTAGRFEDLGLVVRRQPVDVPGGVSWGEPVPAGRSVNVIAVPASFRASRPHVVVGAHLDTVPQAPGAEDNASGVAVLLATAQAVVERRTRLPVVFVAFGAEEPRGETDADHHYGSRTYVSALRPGARRALRGMLSLDRVGVGTTVPIGPAGEGRDALADQLVRAARRARVPVSRAVDRSSDHWQFVRAGLPAVRLGSTPFAAYHSAADLPGVVVPEQLERTGRLVLAWLAP